MQYMADTKVQRLTERRFARVVSPPNGIGRRPRGRKLEDYESDSESNQEPSKCGSQSDSTERIENSESSVSSTSDKPENFSGICGEEEKKEMESSDEDMVCLPGFRSRSARDARCNKLDRAKKPTTQTTPALQNPTTECNAFVKLCEVNIRPLQYNNNSIMKICEAV